MPPHLPCTLPLPILKVIEGLREPLARCEPRINNRLQVLPAEILMIALHILQLIRRHSPSSPGPPLRPVAHQSPLVAGRTDEHVGALARQSVFEAAPGS